MTFDGMTFDEARLMANVNARAQCLFETGYRARWTGPDRLRIGSGRGGTYEVDTQARTCGCPFFQKHQGRHPCKHLLGWRRLLTRQRVCRRLLALMLLDLWGRLDDAPLPETPAFVSAASGGTGGHPAAAD